jgi:hypothetical protein
MTTVDAEGRAALVAELGQRLHEALGHPHPDEIDCPCCGKRQFFSAMEKIEAVDFLYQEKLRRFRCGECDLIFGPAPLLFLPKPDMSELYRLYYLLYEEGVTVSAQEKTFYLLNPAFDGAYLNYGCGYWQEGVQRLRAVQWQVWGFDPHLSEHRRAELHSLGLVISLDQLPHRQFSGLFSHNFIEHTQDPFELFQTLRTLLAPGAAMAHSTPCYEYLFEFSPFHLFFFTGRSIEALAARSGFTIEQSYATDSRTPALFQKVLVFRRTD